MKKAHFLLSVAAAATLWAPATAQIADETADETAGEEGLDVIVVTAQRRQESVQDVPIAISAFTAQELETRGIAEALDIAQFVPNLVGFNNTGLGSANGYYIRGLGNTESIATFDPAVGTYVDDIYLSRQNANNLQFFDVERVEVLRGPQGTLFGRNTTGGAVNVILAEPGDEVAGYAEFGYGAYERFVGRASVDIPLADSLAIKLSGFFDNDDGYAINSTTGERLNDRDGWGARLGIRGELSDTVRWTASYAHIVSDAENTLNFDCDPQRDTCAGRFITTGFREAENDPNGPFVGIFTGEKQFFGNGNRTDTEIVSSNFEIGLGDLTINFITGFVHLEQEFGLDFFDGRGGPSLSVPFPPVQGFAAGGFTIVNDGRHEQFTQEIKLTGSFADGLVDIVAGVFYIDEDNKTDFGDSFTLGIVPGGFPLNLADRTIDNETEAWAGYIQGDLNVSDQLKLTAGVRYTDEEKTFAVSDNRPEVGGGLCFGPNQFAPSTCIDTANLVAANGAPIPTKQQIDLFTPRFAVNYELNRDILLFASATRGFKSGGWNARGTAPGELLPFGPEKVWSYEAGFKSELFDNRVRFNLSAYYLDVSGLQTPSALIRANGSIAFLTRNFADYENYGIEAEVQARPVPGLNVFATLGYQDDEYKLDQSEAVDEFGVTSVAAQLADCRAQLASGLLAGGGATSCGSGIVAPDGTIAEPVRTPDLTVAFGANYEFDFGGGWTLTPAFNANWRDKSEVGTSNLSFFDAPVTDGFGTTFPANTAGNGEFITGSFSDDRWIANASLTLRFDDRYAISAECRNCFDEEAIESSLANYSYLNPPRTWLVKARVNF